MVDGVCRDGRPDSRHRGCAEGCQANVSAQARRSASLNVEMPIELRGYVDVVDRGPAGFHQSPVLPVTRDVRA